MVPPCIFFFLATSCESVIIQSLGFHLNSGISISISHTHDVTMLLASWISPVYSGFPQLYFQQSDTLSSQVIARSSSFFPSNP